MAEIQPFRGVRYNQLLVDDLAKVICPPYDIITPQMRQEFYQRSQYNFIRIEDNQGSPEDTAAGGRYARSSAILEGWLAQGILNVDEAPAIYLHDHYFTYQGRTYRRRGLTVCVRLEEWDSMVVRPHEGTLLEPRGDRLGLLWALQANTSPILALFTDPGQQVSSLLVAEEQKSSPVIDISGADGERHRVRAITEPAAIERLCRRLADQPLYIADGHHRYESALVYQRERQACSSTVSGDEAFNFVMMTLVDFTDTGLLILPPHRLVRGISRSTLSGLMAGLRTFFEIEELSLDTPGVWQQIDGLLAGGKGRATIILFGPEAGQFLVLTLRDMAAASRMMPYFHCELYKGLDVSIVDHIILERILGLGIGGEGDRLAYSYDRLDAVDRVSNQEYQMAILLSPVDAGVIKAIADAGDRMPRKSTYFYPKLPSGLVFYRTG